MNIPAIIPQKNNLIISPLVLLRKFINGLTSLRISALEKNHWKIVYRYQKQSSASDITLADGLFHSSTIDALGVNENTFYLNNELCSEVFNRAVVWKAGKS